MIRQIRALAASALVSLASLMSLSALACAAPTEQIEDGVEVEESSQDIVSRSASFETFQGLDGQHYFVFVAGNGQNVLRSEGYTTLSSAKKGIAAVLTHGADKRSFEVLEAKNGEFYFNMIASNGEIIGTSGLYVSKSNAERGARTVRALVRVARDAVTPAPARESFELFKGEDGRTYFRLRAANGEIMLGSEGYASTRNARDGIASVVAHGTSTARYELVETRDGRVAIRLVATNGQVIARGEAYASSSNAARAVRRLAEILANDLPTAIR